MPYAVIELTLPFPLIAAGEQHAGGRDGAPGPWWGWR
jgi:hypothetical protein